MKLTLVWQQLRTHELALLVGIISVIMLYVLKAYGVMGSVNPIVALGVFIWLFLVILYCVFLVVRHAEALAKLLREPLGTLVLTLSVITIEIVIITSVMLVGAEMPSLARDTMYSVIMVILNGMVGISLLLGGWRHREQSFNLQGSCAFLSAILIIAVVGLILPSHTLSTKGPTFSYLQSLFFIITSISIYVVFLAMQTGPYRRYFIDSLDNTYPRPPAHQAARTVRYYSLPTHLILLILYLLITAILAKGIATPVDFILIKLHQPPALGGFIVAILILSPEAFAAIRASMSNQLQRAMNILLGSVLATISLTIPAVLTVGFFTGKHVVLGLGGIDSIMLMLTLLVSILTFSNGKTNVFQGLLHLLIFVTYVVLIYD